MGMEKNIASKASLEITAIIPKAMGLVFMSWPLENQKGIVEYFEHYSNSDLFKQRIQAHFLNSQCT